MPIIFYNNGNTVLTVLKIKILFITILSLILSIKIFSNQDSSDDLIKRKIAILPVLNISNNNKYDYINSALRINIKSNLENHLENIDFSKIDNEYNNLNLKNLTIYTKETLINFSQNLKADIIVYGSYNIYNNRISVTLNVMDMISDELVAVKTLNGNIEYDFLKTINLITKEQSDLINNYSSMFNYKILDKIRMIDKIDENKKDLLQYLIAQKNKKWYYLLKMDNYSKLIKIPFAKNVILFAFDKKDYYSIETNGEKTDIKEDHKVFYYENDINNNKEYKIYCKGIDRPYIYKYIQKKEYEVNTKLITSETYKKEAFNYILYCEASMLMTTSGFVGIDNRIGFGLPFKSKMENSIYLRSSFFAKLINFVNIEDELRFDKPHYKFRIGFGYQHTFFIKGLVGINVGLELGTEVHLFSFLIKDREKYNIHSLGEPTVYLALPFEVQLFPNKKVGLIVGFDPTLRFVMNFYFYDYVLWYDNLDETRGGVMEFLRFQINDYLTFDLFIYDMPVYISVRFKI